MGKIIFSLIVVTFLLCLSLSFAADLKMYDEKGNYSYGKVKEGGRIEMYDEKGNYSYGKVKEGGRIEMWDEKGNYSYGRIK